MSLSDLASEFSRIFAGLERSSGRYVVAIGAKPGPDGKVLGRAWTSRAPITLALWEAHISGKETAATDEETGEPLKGALGLGVVPIREDGTCVFGAIDVDVYPLDFDRLLARVAELGLPVTVCRTKSGGAHVYLFLSAPASAEIVRERLAEWSVALYFPGVEVFPKQSMLSEHSDGSWINVPYSGGNRSVRYALKADGSAMTVEEFVEHVRATAISPAELLGFELPEEEVDEDLEGAPPCLRTLARVGFGDWQNNGLFNVAVYLKLRHGEGWEKYLDAYNRKLMSPPLGGRDVTALTKSVKKKNYYYKCKDQPIVAVCNRSVCLKCEFGIGSSAADPGIVLGELTKIETDPVIWIVPVDGKELELSTADLTDQRRFRAVVIERLAKWPNMMKPEDWQESIRVRLERATVVKVPVDGTREGQFAAHLANFAVGRSRARNLDEILLGKAYTDAKAGRAYFRSTDLFDYLVRHRFSTTEREVWRFLRHLGAEHHQKTLKGKFTNYWSVPAFPEQGEEHAVPRAAALPEM